MALSPDGQRVLSVPSRSSTELDLLPTGPGESRRLKHKGIQDFAWVGWFPDGKRIAFQAHAPGRGGRIYVQDLASGRVQPVTPEGIRPTRFAATISPDGKWIAAVDLDNKITLYPVAGGNPRTVLSPASDDHLVCWSEDGRSLYAYRIGGVPGKVYRVDVSTGTRTLWKEMMPSDPAGIWRIHPIRVAPDGRSYAYTYTRNLTDLYLVEGLK